MEAPRQISFRYVYNIFLLQFNVPENVAAMVYYSMLHEINTRRLIMNWMRRYDVIWTVDGIQLFFIKMKSIQKGRFNVRTICPKFYVLNNAFRFMVTILTLGNSIMLEYDKSNHPEYNLYVVNYVQDELDTEYPLQDILNSRDLSVPEYYNELDKLMNFFINM